MGNKITLFETTCNCYAIENGNDIALVDIGSKNVDLDAFVAKNADRIKYVLLTHAHYDHIMGVEEILNKTSAKLVVFINETLMLADPRQNLCNAMGLKQPNLKPDIDIFGKITLPFGDTEISALHTPGHTAGSCMYIIDNDAFCGDTVFLRGIGRTDLPCGDAQRMASTIKKLNEIEFNYNLYPGHGKSTTLFYEKLNNPFFQEENLRFI